VPEHVADITESANDRKIGYFGSPYLGGRRASHKFHRKMLLEYLSTNVGRKEIFQIDTWEFKSLNETRNDNGVTVVSFAI
jgi:hypothetical protein